MHENQKTKEIVEEERKSANVLTVLSEPDLNNALDISKYSSLEKVVRVKVCVNRFVNNLKAAIANIARKIGVLSVEELLDSARSLTRSAQAELKKRSNFQQLAKALGLSETKGGISTQR